MRNATEGVPYSRDARPFAADALRRFAAFALGNEAVTGVANRKKVPRLGRVGLENLPQPADELIGGPGVDAAGHVPKHFPAARGGE